MFWRIRENERKTEIREINSSENESENKRRQSGTGETHKQMGSKLRVE